MNATLGLYPQRALPLFPGDGLRLHPFPTVVDLCAVRCTWEHHTYGGGGFGDPRLRPLWLRVRPPASGSLPLLIAATGIEYTGYEVIRHSSSLDFGQIIDVDRYFRSKLALFEPEIVERRTNWLRVRSEGAGIVFAHGLERQHMTWYQKNADTWFANQGVLVIGFNTAHTSWPLIRSVYPDLTRAEYAFYAEFEPPLPTSLEVPELMPSPAPLPSGLWQVEVSHGAVAYNEGRWDPPHRPGTRLSGIANLDLEVLAGQDRPLADIVGGGLTSHFVRQLVRERGEGTVPADDYDWAIPLDFGD